MSDSHIRDARSQDFDRIVELNETEVKQTSTMDTDRLRVLDSLSSYHRVYEVAGKVEGFLLAIDSKKAYENANFRWFAERYPDFIYIDRIVVNANHKGQGIGRKLYRDLFDCVNSHELPLVCCEFNLIPPNRASEVFHTKMGFKQVGEQQHEGSFKLVSMQVNEIKQQSSERSAKE
ncbi:MAG: GNAT family N-acetyltransferase [Gammaproteobacteria bacterium]|nr:GNAT family N-acetyltransferase [Gammaproteobacteria bacterium]